MHCLCGRPVSFYAKEAKKNTFLKEEEYSYAGFSGRQRGKDGFFLSIRDFPFAIPNAKNLWFNDKIGENIAKGKLSSYIASISCNFDDTAFLKFLFHIDNTEGVNVRIEHNRKGLDKEPINQIPTIAYLPHLSNVSAHEPLYVDSHMKGLISDGRVGEVLRNIIYRLRGKEAKKKESYEAFKDILETLFGIKLKDSLRKSEFARYLTLERKVLRGKSREIMLEGSGVLQWMMVLAYALYEDIDVLLLDEPESHMHGDLQLKLFHILLAICKYGKKQILMTTHSVRIIQECAKIKKEEYNDYLNVLGVDGEFTGHQERLKYQETEDDILDLLETIDKEALKQLEEIKDPVILVEGKTDELVYNAVIEVFFSKYKKRVTVREREGLENVKKEAKILEDKEKPYFIIVDGKNHNEKKPGLTEKCQAKRLGDIEEDTPSHIKQIWNAMEKCGCDKKIFVISLEEMYPPEVWKHAQKEEWLEGRPGGGLGNEDIASIGNELKNTCSLMYFNYRIKDNKKEHKKTELAEYVIEKAKKNCEILRPFVPYVGQAISSLFPKDKA